MSILSENDHLSTFGLAGPWAQELNRTKVARKDIAVLMNDVFISVKLVYLSAKLTKIIFAAILSQVFFADCQIFHTFAVPYGNRKVGRVVDGGSLENC